MSIRKTLCAWLGCCTLPTPIVPTGPGAAPARPLVGIYGDSLTVGTVEGQPNNINHVPPVRRINEHARGRFFGISYGRPGATAGDAIAGAWGLVYARWAEHVAQAPDHVMVLRFGGADYLLGVPPADFVAHLRTLVQQAQAAGKAVVLVGIPDLTPGVLGFDGLVRQVAQAEGVRYIDLSGVAINPGDQPDGFHPGQALSDRIAEVIARELLDIIGAGG
ncbi:SGNH/GDSL hydrolase family protein [Acidovorax lacteus]|uniref:SGNH hydrolase-type esterase domain-containing protein n=1 Tax=Acidovorax lacteus TaxID=1924988 RepID=A0ABP8LCD4_9BURK